MCFPEKLPSNSAYRTLLPQLTYFNHHSMQILQGPWLAKWPIPRVVCKARRTDEVTATFHVASKGHHSNQSLVHDRMIDIHLQDTKHMSNKICLCFVEICNILLYIIHDFHAEYHGSYRRLGLQFRQKPLQWFGLVRKPKYQTSQDGNMQRQTT